MKKERISPENLIIKRLEVIVALLLKIMRKNGKSLSLRNQIVMLRDLGLGPTEIAEIIGRSVNYITKELSLLKKQKK